MRKKEEGGEKAQTKISVHQMIEIVRNENRREKKKREEEERRRRRRRRRTTTKKGATFSPYIRSNRSSNQKNSSLSTNVDVDHFISLLIFKGRSDELTQIFPSSVCVDGGGGGFPPPAPAPAPPPPPPPPSAAA